MLNEQEVKDKLHDYADQFQLRCRRKEWAAAKMLYFRAQTVATFLEFPEAELAKLFGNRAYREDWEPLKDGLFPERDVERAGWECVRIHRTYDDLHLRPLPRYGPMYVKGWKDIGGGKVCQRRFKNVRKRRLYFVVFRRSHVTFSSVSLLKKCVYDLLLLTHEFLAFFQPV